MKQSTNNWLFSVKTLKTICMVCLLLVICAVTPSAWAMSFSAHLHSNEGDMGKMYLDGSKMRMETQDGIMIMRRDKMVMWVLMPEDKVYMEQPLNQAVGPKHLPDNDIDSGERVFIAKETINGYAADKYKVTIKGDSHYEWISNDPGIPMPVRTAALDDSWWNEYREISTAVPDAGVFEIPAGYSKMSVPGM